MPGVAAWVSAKDVPGENKVKGGASDSPVFAAGRVEHMGQVIGLVIADTPRHAQDAAAKVNIQYGHPKASCLHTVRCVMEWLVSLFQQESAQTYDSSIA